MTGDVGSAHGGPPQGGFPFILGWEIDEELVWMNDTWSQRWRLYIELPDRTVHTVIVYSAFAQE